MILYVLVAGLGGSSSEAEDESVDEKMASKGKVKIIIEAFCCFVSCRVTTKCHMGIAHTGNRKVMQQWWYQGWSTEPARRSQASLFVEAFLQSYMKRKSKKQAQFFYASYIIHSCRCKPVLSNQIYYYF